MRTVIVGEPTADFVALLERRRHLGQDLFDEVWNGEYHMTPAPNFRHGAVVHDLAAALLPDVRAAGLRGAGPFNLGTADNYRVPDYGFVVARVDEVFVSTAAIVIEVASPGDETYEKFGHYFDHGVEEFVIADPAERAVHWFVRGAHEFVSAERSPLLGIEVAHVVEAIDWT